MKKSFCTKKIWGLKDYSIDEIASHYVKAENTYGLYSKSAPMIMPKIQLPNAPKSECDEPKAEKKTVVKREKLLAKKYEFLIHTIIKRVLNNDNGIAYLHTLPFFKMSLAKIIRKCWITYIRWAYYIQMAITLWRKKHTDIILHRT